MKKPMETIGDLIEEAKLRTLWWAICIFAVSYFLTHTSKSMWMNVPIGVLIVAGLRILLNEVDIHWKDKKGPPLTYLSHLEKKQLSANDSRLSTAPLPPKWKRKIDSPVVEAALEDFVQKILQDFVVDLWYSAITPDMDAPQLIHDVIMDALGEVSGRVKEINLVDLLTRDAVDLIGVHIDVFRRNQATIGVDVMATLSSEERDERLKHHLMASKELHPALVSAECEYKYLQQLMGGVLAVVLRPRESQCPLVRCIAREILTCLVMQPVMNLASPLYINQLLEVIFNAVKDVLMEGGVLDQFANAGNHNGDPSFPSDSVQFSNTGLGNNSASDNQRTDMVTSQIDKQRWPSLDTQGNTVSATLSDEEIHPRSGDWARVLEAATQRRTEVLMPENLENMWAKGRNYKKKLQKKAPGKIPAKDSRKEVLLQKPETNTSVKDKTSLRYPLKPRSETGVDGHNLYMSQKLPSDTYFRDRVPVEEHTSTVETLGKFRKSNSASDIHTEMKNQFASTGGAIIAEYYSSTSSRRNEVHSIKSGLDMVVSGEAAHAPKLKCRINNAFFENIASKPVAVYQIEVTDADNNTWSVMRRYSNFERLHRYLKEIPNYTLHLPPKRIFSSSTADALVCQRRIQLEKYLQDLLSIANVAEQHEVWDFLSTSSKNYSFGKSPSVMRTLVVSVDDTVDEVVRQFKGVSDGFRKKVVGSPPSASTVAVRHESLNGDDINTQALRSFSDSVNSYSDNEEADKDGYGLDEVDKDGHGPENEESSAHANGWHSDNLLNSRDSPPKMIKLDEDFEKKHDSTLISEPLSRSKHSELSLVVSSNTLRDPVDVPPEWTPPNLCLPMLNLVDNVFQLNRRGWLRRQVFWMSKQILQLMMEDAIDDWLLREIHWLRREDVVSRGIRWIQDILWPDGKFFLKLNIPSGLDDGQQHVGPVQSRGPSEASKISKPGSFEQQLEAARRASYVKKMLFDGAPAALVSLIGQKQYRRSARDIYYFTQSTICLKQVAYAMLELVLVSIFPELRELVIEIHEKMRAEGGPVFR